MISAKRMAFRQEIRRRQINAIFKNKRREIIQQIKGMQKKSTYVEQVQSILYNLEANIVEKNCFSIYEGSMELKKIITGSPRQLMKLIIHEEFKVIQIITKTLDFLNNTDIQARHKLVIYENLCFVLRNIMGEEQISSTRVRQSGIIQSLIPFLQMAIQKQKTLENIFSFFANALKKSSEMACLYTRLGIPQLLIQLIHRNDPKVFSHSLWQFLFFVRNYFEEMRSGIVFSKQQIQVCVIASQQVIKYLMSQRMEEQSPVVALEDALCVTKELINMKMLPYDSPDMDYEKFVDIVNVKNYSIQAKRQCLYILDTMIFYDDEGEITRELVFQKNMLNKIYGVDQQLMYITLNIFANVALNPSFKSQIKPFIPRIKLLLCLNLNHKEIYIFILNYFGSQNYDIKDLAQDSLINQLWSRGPDNRPQLLSIESKIWLGLCSNGYPNRPPSRVLEAKNLKEVQDIIYCLQYPQKFNNMSSQQNNQNQMQVF